MYDVTLSTSDDEFTTSLAVAITVQNVNEAPTITGNASPSFAENGTGAVATYSATDPEGTTATLTVGGTDADSFNLTERRPHLRTTPPNYEAKKSYWITISASDGSASSYLAVTVTITNVNEPPAYSGDTEIDVPEAAEHGHQGPSVPPTRKATPSPTASAEPTRKTCRTAAAFAQFQGHPGLRVAGRRQRRQRVRSDVAGRGQRAERVPRRNGNGDQRGRGAGDHRRLRHPQLRGERTRARWQSTPRRIPRAMPSPGRWRARTPGPSTWATTAH